MFKGHVVTGTVEGTGAAINISCGFRPAYVKILNIDGLAELEWTDSMPAAAGTKRVTAGTMSLIASGGISQFDGTIADVGAGFTIGADADVNVSGETIHYLAIGKE